MRRGCLDAGRGARPLPLAGGGDSYRLARCDISVSAPRVAGSVCRFPRSAHFPAVRDWNVMVEGVCVWCAVVRCPVDGFAAYPAWLVFAPRFSFQCVRDVAVRFVVSFHGRAPSAQKKSHLAGWLFLGVAIPGSVSHIGVSSSIVFLCGLWRVGGFHVEEVGGEVLALVVWGEDAALFPCGDGGFVVAECGEGLSWEEGVGVLFEGFPELLAGGWLGLRVGLEVAGDFAEAGP